MNMKQLLYDAPTLIEHLTAEGMNGRRRMWRRGIRPGATRMQQVQREMPKGIGEGRVDRGEC